MGIGGLDAEFSNIFRRAFASRIFPPGLVDKLGIQHVKGNPSLKQTSDVLIVLVRYIALWSTRNRQNAHGSTNWQDAQCERTENR